MGRDGDSRHAGGVPDGYRDDQTNHQRDAEQHGGGDAERSGTHRVAAPRALKHEDKQAKSARSDHAMNDGQKRLALTAKVKQRQGHAQRHRRRQYPGGGADYANTPNVRRRAMSSAA